MVPKYKNTLDSRQKKNMRGLMTISDIIQFQIPSLEEFADESLVSQGRWGGGGGMEKGDDTLKSPPRPHCTPLHCYSRVPTVHYLKKKTNYMRYICVLCNALQLDCILYFTVSVFCICISLFSTLYLYFTAMQG